MTDRLLTQLLGIVIDDSALVDEEVRNTPLNSNPNDISSLGSDNSASMSQNNNRNPTQSDKFTFENTDLHNSNSILYSSRQSASPSSSGKHSSSTSSMVKIIDIQRRAHRSSPVSSTSKSKRYLNENELDIAPTSLIDFSTAQLQLEPNELESSSNSNR